MIDTVRAGPGRLSGVARPWRPVLAAVCAVLAGCQPATPAHTAAPPAREVRVLVSGGFTAALAAIAPTYRRRHGDPLVVERGPSMGDTPQAIPQRLARREPADVVILARGALDTLAARGSVVPGSVVDLGLSKIAVAVRAGAPGFDISTPAAVRDALLRARSVAWSDSASGVYIQSEMLRRLGVEQAVRTKGRMIPATPVGEIVARGDAEIGFQQLSELKPVRGIRILGVLPDALQKVTPFSGGIVSYAPNPTGARRLLDYLSSPAAAAAIRASGLEPAPRKVHP